MHLLNQFKATAQIFEGGLTASEGAPQNLTLAKSDFLHLWWNELVYEHDEKVTNSFY